MPGSPVRVVALAAEREVRADCRTNVCGEAPLTTPSSADQPGGWRTADSLLTVRVVVMLFVLVDTATTLVGQARGRSDWGPSGVVPSVQLVVLVAAVAATLWGRPRLAAVLAGVVVVLLFAPAPQGRSSGCCSSRP